MTRLLWGFLILLMPALWAPAVAAVCPAPSDRAARLVFAGTELARPHRADVIAGGRLDLAACPEAGGAGRVTGDPDFAVDIVGADARAFEFRTAGDCDTVLLVATSGGRWLFDDDGAGREDARLRLAAADGRYHVWVGTYGPGSCRARLIVEGVR